MCGRLAWVPGGRGVVRGKSASSSAPLAAHQLVQELIADIAVDTDAARALTWLVADLADAGARIDLAASKAKIIGQALTGVSAFA